MCPLFLLMLICGLEFAFKDLGFCLVSGLEETMQMTHIKAIFLDVLYVY